MLISERETLTFASNPSRTPFFSHTLQQLTYRHLFIRQLIPIMVDANYALLHPSIDSISSLGRFSKIEFLISLNELAEWKSICRYSHLIESHRIIDRSTKTQIYLVFKDQSDLCITLTHCLRERELVIANTDTVLSQVVIEKDGLKKVSPQYLFESTLIKKCLNKQSFYEQEKMIWRLLSSSTTTQIINYLQKKYELPISSLQVWMTDIHIYRPQIVRALFRQPENKGMGRWLNAWDFVRDSTRGTLNKVAAFMF